jgi:hypothetical protein
MRARAVGKHRKPGFVSDNHRGIFSSAVVNPYYYKDRICKRKPVPDPKVYIKPAFLPCAYPPDSLPEM